MKPFILTLALLMLPAVAHAQKPDQARPDQVRPDQAKPDQVRPDQTAVQKGEKAHHRHRLFGRGFWSGRRARLAGRACFRGTCR